VSTRTRYFALVDVFAPDPLMKPRGIFRLVETPTTLAPERFDRASQSWVLAPDLVRYTSGGEIGAEEITAAQARRLVKTWGGTLATRPDVAVSD
jgi:hypothetical protein